MKRTLNISLFSFLLFYMQDIRAQISVPKLDCFKNLTDFIYYPPSGLSITAIKWSYGDGGSSNSNPQKYIYKAPGTYKVKVQVQFSNNTTATDSQTIVIAPL